MRSIPNGKAVWSSKGKFWKFFLSKVRLMVFLMSFFFSIPENGLNTPITLPFSNFLANVSRQITEFYQAILSMATMYK